MDWMVLPLKRYAEFTGRSRRMEYWMFALFCVIVYIICGALMFSGGLDPATMSGDPSRDFSGSEIGPMFWLGTGLMGLFGLAILIPSIALNVRRLHDRNMSGWWYLGVIVLSFIPLLGAIVALGYLVLMFLPGTPGPNRFGEDPRMLFPKAPSDRFTIP